jgi:hypothetical protein
VRALIVASVPVFWLSGIAGQSLVPPTPRRPTCEQAVTAAAREVCLADEQVRRADAAPKASLQRRQQLQAAAARYRESARHTSSFELAELALDRLVKVYDAEHLNEPDRMERVWRELIALRMGMISLGEHR